MSVRVVSVPQWAGRAGLADDGKSIAAARSLIAQGLGPIITKIQRPTTTVQGVRLSDHDAWAQANAWAAYLASLPASEREQYRSQAMRIVGDAAYTARLFERYSTSRWRFHMTFERWLKRRQRLKDRHSPRTKGGSR
jgi:hypothetical protein